MLTRGVLTEDRFYFLGEFDERQSGLLLITCIIKLSYFSRGLVHVDRIVVFVLVPETDSEAVRRFFCDTEG